MKEKKYTPPIRRYSSQKWQGMNKIEMRMLLNELYKKMIGKTAINKEIKTPIIIEFNNRGRKKTLSVLKNEDRVLKAAVVEHLLELLRNAELIAVEQPKHNTYALKALTFLICCYIDYEYVEFKATVMKKKEGYFHYDLSQL